MGDLKNCVVGVLGAGSMGSGIAQVAASAGHKVILFDTNNEALEKGYANILKIIDSLTSKGKMAPEKASAIKSNIVVASNQEEYAPCGVIIEAIVEKLEIKQAVFSMLEKIVSQNCILATNTSSLSVTSIASACDKPERVIGVHFFNPAPLMPLVEIIPGISTGEELLYKVKDLIVSWHKTAVIAKDTPGFIVNRIARPFYGESIRILEEGIADIATIDWAMKEIGGFRMGPFELMDYIGNDVNYTVTETVFKEFYFDSRYKPSFTQKRLVEAKRFGRKSGIGYYDYSLDAVKSEPLKDVELGSAIVNRVIAMLINEAADALLLKIATSEDLDLAMTKGVNYPKGLLNWADEIGINNVLSTLQFLQDEYGEDRYRPSALLKRKANSGEKFFG